jgi:hypothetical protein
MANFRLSDLKITDDYDVREMYHNRAWRAYTVHGQLKCSACGRIVNLEGFKHVGKPLTLPGRKCWAILIPSGEECKGILYPDPTISYTIINEPELEERPAHLLPEDEMWF